MRRLSRWGTGVALFATLAGGFAQTVQAQGTSTNPINHIIVIYLENHSFDNLYGSFPGANGLSNATAAEIAQVDKTGTPYSTLPQPNNTSLKTPGPDSRFPSNLPVQPFDIDKYVTYDMKTGDLVHRFYQEQLQIDGGKMDKFVAYSDSAGLSMGYYQTSELPLYQYAKQYVLADNFFHAAFGGSFLNHFWLICACSPVWPNAPTDIVAQLDASGNLVKDGQVTPNGYAVNTSYPANGPHPKTVAADHLVPPQTMPTIGDRLNDKNVSWAWYSGGWTNALAGNPDPLFQFHHQVFDFFQNYGDGTPGNTQHLKDETDFVAALQNGSLPAVSFIKPLGEDNEHPGYADLKTGEDHTVQLLQDIQNSQYWKDSAVIITYDENGGQWDHVAPPKTDVWGPGTRVPTLIISAYAKKGFVDHTQMDTTSILAFIEARFGLQPLATRDAAANNMMDAFDFTQQPAAPVIIVTAPAATAAPTSSSAAATQAATPAATKSS